MGRTPCFHCYQSGFTAGLLASQAVWLKKKERKKELLTVLLFFHSRKIDEGSGI